MTPVEAALVRHALAQSRIVRELLANHYRAEETETSGGRLMRRSAEADTVLTDETGLPT